MSASDQDIAMRGHCYCGAIRFEVRFPAGTQPAFSAYCHCDSCRRSHAAPLYHVVAVERSSFEITSGAESLNEFTKPGGSITRAFCTQCGSKILNRFGAWRPGGKELTAFFPNTLVESAQRDYRDLIRPTRHNFPADRVLDEELLHELFEE